MRIDTKIADRLPNRLAGGLALAALLACPAIGAASEGPAEAGRSPAPTLRAAEPARVAGAVPAPPAPPREITAWLAGGVGPGGIAGEGSVLARVELAIGYGVHLFSLSYAHSEDTNGSCGGEIFCSNDVSLPRNSASEVAVRYGVKARAPYVLGTASIGVAALWGVQRGNNLLSRECFFGCVSNYDALAFRTVGATAEVGGYLSSRFVSFGPAVIVDVNPFQSFWAVIVDLHIGFVGSPSTSHRGTP